VRFKLMYSSGLSEGIVPVVEPLVIGAMEAQGQQVFGVVGAPPCAGTFESLLDEVAMSALDLAGTDGQILA